MMMDNVFIQNQLFLSIEKDFNLKTFSNTFYVMEQLIKKLVETGRV